MSSNSQSHVFPRHAKARLPVAAGGEGPYLFDTEGKRYLDACGGAAVSCLGHGNTAVIEATKAQLDTLAWAHTGFFTSEPAETLADMLADRAPGDLNRVYFVSGGSEATEAAMKLARQFFLEKGETSRRHIIARWQSYHGNTLGALSASGNRWRRAPFEPLMVGAMEHIDPCHYWRWGEPGETPEQYGRRMADQLETKIEALGAENVAAYIMEPVVGATMGAVPPAPGYMQRIREICDRHGVLLIFDEVMCGMGRTGHLFACAEDGVTPDIVCIAKGLGAGIQPIGAMICTDQVYDALAGGSGAFQHGHTYIGHPTACAAGVAVLQEIERHDLLANVREKGADLRARLEAAYGQHPHVGDIRGRGLFLGMELVADRATKETFDPALKIHAGLKREAMAEGLMIYPMGGTIDGGRGDHVLIAPPFIIDNGHLNEFMEKFDRAFARAVPASARAA
ncbi:MAG: aspartate aminotransferase family protein [Pseudomonadota bacterium]